MGRVRRVKRDKERDSDRGRKEGNIRETGERGKRGRKRGKREG